MTNGVCRNGSCPNARSAKPIERYPGPGEYCPVCGYTLEPLASAAPATAPFAAPPAPPVSAEVVEPPPSRSRMRKRVSIAALVAIAAVVGVAMLRPTAAQRPTASEKIRVSMSEPVARNAVYAGEKAQTLAPTLPPPPATALQPTPKPTPRATQRPTPTPRPKATRQPTPPPSEEPQTPKPQSPLPLKVAQHQATLHRGDTSPNAPARGQRNSEPADLAAVPTASDVPATTAPSPPPTPRPTPTPLSCARPDVPASIVRAAVPVTPPMAEQQAITGTVQVVVSLNAQNHVVGTRVQSSPSNVLNAAALTAARGSLFRTQIKNCDPVAADYILNVNFVSQ